ncbi:Heat shock protein Hsp-16.48/Hsp-16.49 [Thelohanellus kitauei]|uniref:Heat shock protein Hsp-16.48/Hsp-16.49 n=1 Tax=Thelohanellus kitauei TaxID=669202 RepID=A0A0C2N0M6_THEKT|nr:Heat shock protein Hsp-16.48/Hsp-16.49 [Thelohanellus kitauei]
MLTPFCHFPRFLTVEDELGDFMSNVMDVVSPFAYSPLDFYDPFRMGHHRKPHEKKYVISISVGPHYKIEDIHTSLDGKKLKVDGSSVQTTPNGQNQHQFSREYDIPDDVDLKTMKKHLSADGTIHITFDKVFVEPKKDIEDLSKDTEFKLKINTHGFKPEEISVRIVGRDLIIEATRKCEAKTETCKADSCYSRYLKRSVRLGDEVDIEKVRVLSTADGCLEIVAPRDLSKIKAAERKLEIEK